MENKPAPIRTLMFEGSFVVRLVFWGLLGVLAGMPMLVLAGIQRMSVAAAVLATAVAVCLWTAVSALWPARRFMSLPRASDAMVTAIGVRLIMSVVPCCWIFDFVLGAISYRTASLVLNTRGGIGDPVLGFAVAALNLAFHTLFIALLAVSVRRLSLHYDKGWRAEQGLCIRCGYDLRGSVENCPECGKRIPSSTKRQSIDSESD